MIAAGSNEDYSIQLGRDATRLPRRWLTCTTSACYRPRTTDGIGGRGSLMPLLAPSFNESFALPHGLLHFSPAPFGYFDDTLRGTSLCKCIAAVATRWIGLELDSKRCGGERPVRTNRALDPAHIRRVKVSMSIET
mmetsp:Transcript_1890/g.5906  ORF Transcript_1890/g.5906 Transcript_1890/m.5906 type:complete len:136 (-) Transcript_1890:1823-2230(-)|eukprot:scaffold56629_cov29-Tisochrysis_lutea.AAC.3